MSDKIAKAIETLRAEGRQEAAAFQAEQLARRAADEKANAEERAQKWRPLVDAVREVLPPALHGFLTVPTDRDPRTYASREVRHAPATLALPGCTPIHIYPSREGSLFFRAATWDVVGDSDEGEYWAQLTPDDSVVDYELGRMFRSLPEAIEAAAIAAGDEEEAKAAAVKRAEAWAQRQRLRIEREEFERKTSPEAFLESAINAPIEHAGTFALLSIAQSLIKITGQIARSND